MKKRYVFLALVLILAIICTTVLVACDANSDGSNPPAGSDSSASGDGGTGGNGGSGGNGDSGNTDGNGNQGTGGNGGNIGDSGSQGSGGNGGSGSQGTGGNTGGSGNQGSGGNGSQGDGGESASTIESELNDGALGPALLEALYGYTLKTHEREPQADCEALSVFSGTTDQHDIAEGWQGYFYTAYTVDKPNDNEDGYLQFEVIYLHFFDSVAHAVSAKQNELAEMQEGENFGICEQVGKTVILGTSEEVWNDVKVSKVQNAESYITYGKLLEAIKTSNRKVFIEDIYGKKGAKTDKYCYLKISPSKGNCYETYEIFPATDTYMESRFLEGLGKYTDDSYIMRKGDDFECYSKMKAGMHFALNESDGESYALQYFYTETDVTSLTIPSSYNGKPVTKIDSYFNLHSSITTLTIPKSITNISDILDGSNVSDVHYEGTKEEWANVRKESYPHSKYPTYTVHCLDGDITVTND